MKTKSSYFYFFTLVFSFFIFNSSLFAKNPAEQIGQILSMEQAPLGIVFEIVTGAENSLRWALPKTQQLIKRLRARFPKLEIAIVTHGNEQFALTKSNTKKYKKIHSLTQQLVQENGVQLHVCGTFAEMNKVEEEAFPRYVDVTAEGPATIDDYISLGFILIKI